MNTCQELNPDPKDELDSTSDEEDDEEGAESNDSPYTPMNGAVDTDFGNRWYTSDNIHDGVELNDEGIANLARILRGSRTDDNDHEDQHNGDEPMDDA